MAGTRRGPICTAASPVVGSWEKMRVEEAVYQPATPVLQNHPDLAGDMRAILFDWMMEVCTDMLLKRETCHQAFNYTDRYLGLTRDCPRSRLQLVGTVSLYISAKAEEIFPPKAHEFVTVCDGAYSLSDLLKAELDVVNALRWRLAPPTLYTWANWYAHSLAVGVRDCAASGPAAGRPGLLAAPPGEAGSLEADPASDTAASCSGHDHSHGSDGDRNGDDSALRELRLSRALGRVPDAQRWPAVPTLERVPAMPRERGSASVELALITRLMAMLDVAALNEQSAGFAPSRLAAAALFIAVEQEDTVTRITRYSLSELLPALAFLRSWLAEVPVVSIEHPRIQYLRTKLPFEDLATMQTHSPGVLFRVRQVSRRRAARSARNMRSVFAPPAVASPAARREAAAVSVPGTALPAHGVPCATPSLRDTAPWGRRRERTRTQCRGAGADMQAAVPTAPAVPAPTAQAPAVPAPQPPPLVAPVAPPTLRQLPAVHILPAATAVAEKRGAQGASAGGGARQEVSAAAEAGGSAAVAAGAHAAGAQSAAAATGAETAVPSATVAPATAAPAAVAPSAVAPAVVAPTAATTVAPTVEPTTAAPTRKRVTRSSARLAATASAPVSAAATGAVPAASGAPRRKRRRPATRSWADHTDELACVDDGDRAEADGF